METSEQMEQNLTNSTEEPEMPAAPPEKLTRKQIGQLRRQYLTTAGQDGFRSEHDGDRARRSLGRAGTVR